LGATACDPGSIKCVRVHRCTSSLHPSRRLHSLTRPADTLFTREIPGWDACVEKAGIKRFDRGCFWFFFWLERASSCLYLTKIFGLLPCTILHDARVRGASRVLQSSRCSVGKGRIKGRLGSCTRRTLAWVEWHVRYLSLRRMVQQPTAAQLRIRNRVEIRGCQCRAPPNELNTTRVAVVSLA
jgi:hypothetical protein